MRTWRLQVKTGESLGEGLGRLTKLSPEELSEAARKGAVWIQRQGKGKILRERSLESRLTPGDLVTLNYEPRVLALPDFTAPVCLGENARYGVWFKPAGVLSQGSEAGDHASLLRAVELLKKKDLNLIHRLDRETAGLMVIGYTVDAAKKLSEMFQLNLITKVYEAIVLGEMPVASEGTIEASLDGKKAVTHYKVLASAKNRSLLQLRIETGRLHQIRRHMDYLGYPVMGDPKYGKGNKNRAGLQLLARTLSFQDPWEMTVKSWTSDESLTLPL